SMGALMQPAELLEVQRALQQIHTSASLIDYVQSLAQATRAGDLFAEGISPRAAIALVQAARAWAALEGRDHVLPEDVQAVLIPVIAHRLRPLKSVSGKVSASSELLSQLMMRVAA
ncbi:MAG: AAA family ATPase, partial [Burkholderiaceae bacterium]|nr:AAA family ATPase [Burkholderiaceae bacterium]